MATREQCEKALWERIKTTADVYAFAREWGGEVKTGARWDEERIVSENIKRWVKQAHQKELLDVLGTLLDLPSDKEQARRARLRVERHSSIAIWISVGSLIVALASFLVALCVALFKE